MIVLRTDNVLTSHPQGNPPNLIREGGEAVLTEAFKKVPVDPPGFVDHATGRCSYMGHREADIMYADAVAVQMNMNSP
ncbi:hypothetical protein JCM8547_003553 [Rhodosporidiobolus lusitaniae]